jgi:hypothetical protein
MGYTFNKHCNRTLIIKKIKTRIDFKLHPLIIKH